MWQLRLYNQNDLPVFWISPLKDIIDWQLGFRWLLQNDILRFGISSRVKRNDKCPGPSSQDGKTITLCQGSVELETHNSLIRWVFESRVCSRKGCRIPGVSWSPRTRCACCSHRRPPWEVPWKRSGDEGSKTGGTCKGTEGVGPSMRSHRQVLKTYTVYI